MAEVRRVAVAFEGLFTRVPNQWVRDERLSRRARGLLVELFSHSIGWTVSERSLIDGGPEGRDAIRGALRELESHGYLVREQSRDDGGLFGSGSWVTCDPWADSTVDGLSVAGSSVAGESAPHIRREITKKTNTQKSCSSGDERADEVKGARVVELAFSAFWSCYPRKVGKPVAERAFARAVKRAGGTTPVLEGARRLRDDPNLPTGDEVRFIPHPSTWLNRDGWEEGPLPGRGGAGGFAGALAAAADADAHFAALEAQGGFALEAGGA